MCLAVPGKIVLIQGDVATVDYGAEQRQGKIIEGNYAKEEYVIISGGIVVCKVEKGEAEQSLKAYREAVE